MTRRERIEAMALKAEEILRQSPNVSIAAGNYGLKCNESLLKSLRAYGFTVRAGILGYVEFTREETKTS